MPPPRQPAVAADQAYEYLDRAQRLLEAPCPPLHQSNSWITNYEAVDAHRVSVEPHSDLAVAYCVIGSVKAVVHYAVDTSPDVTYKYIISLLNMANPRIIANDNIPSVNDAHSTFDQVILMFEKAKALALRFGNQRGVTKS